MGGTCSQCGKCRTILGEHGHCNEDYLQPLSPPVLENPVGEQNCFLNSCVQVLWNLETFNLNDWSPRYGLPKVLKELFVSEDNIRSADALRSELAKMHQEKFAVRQPADAAEAMQEILVEVHCSSLLDAIKSSDTASNEHCWPACPAHETFYLRVVDREACECSEAKRAWDYSTFILPVYAEELLSIKASPNKVLSSYLSAVHSTERRCENCGHGFMRTFIVEPQATVMMLQVVGQLKAMETLELFQILSSPLPFAGNFVFKGFISYGVGHYVTYFRNSRDELWHLYDDCSTRRVGGLNSVVAEMLSRRSFPFLVIFEVSSIRHERLTEFELEYLKNTASRLDKPLTYHTPSAYSPIPNDYSPLRQYPLPDNSLKERNLELIKFTPAVQANYPFNPATESKSQENSPLVSDLLLPTKASTSPKPHIPMRVTTSTQFNMQRPIKASAASDSWRCKDCLSKYKSEELQCSKCRPK